MFLPVGLSGGALVAYCLATHLVFRTIFTIVNIPYVALSAQMTQDSDKRGQLAAARMLFAICCGLALAALTLPLVGALGGGRIGFFLLNIIYSVAAIAILLICFGSTREAVTGDAADHPNISAMLATLRANRPFLLLFAATALGAIGYTMSSKALIYYFKYWVGSEDAVTSGLVVTLAAAALAMIPWMIVAKRLSKRFVWLSGATLNVIGYLIVLTVAPREGAVLWLTLVIVGVGNSAFILTFWSMLPDTVEYGEWKTGTRAEGPIFGLIAFAQKLAFGLGTGLIGVVLNATGYVANRPQSSEALHGIILLYGAGPLLLFAGSMVAIWVYPLDGPTHRRIVRVIDWRRARAARAGLPA
jgi:GPH family glycoside/pentoside/hexuronide:cation symporter